MTRCGQQADHSAWTTPAGLPTCPPARPQPPHRPPRPLPSQRHHPPTLTHGGPTNGVRPPFSLSQTRSITRGPDHLDHLQGPLQRAVRVCASALHKTQNNARRRSRFARAPVERSRLQRKHRNSKRRLSRSSLVWRPACSRRRASARSSQRRSSAPTPTKDVRCSGLSWSAEHLRARATRGTWRSA